MKLFTWKDVDRVLLLKKNLWDGKILAIDVYPTDVTITAKKENFPSICDTLKNLLPSNFDQEKNCIRLD